MRARQGDQRGDAGGQPRQLHGGVTQRALTAIAPSIGSKKPTRGPGWACASY